MGTNFSFSISRKYCFILYSSPTCSSRDIGVGGKEDAHYSREFPHQVWVSNPGPYPCYTSTPGILCFYLMWVHVPWPMWQSEDKLWESVLFFSFVDPGDQTQVVRLRLGKHLYCQTHPRLVSSLFHAGTLTSSLRSWIIKLGVRGNNALFPPSLPASAVTVLDLLECLRMSAYFLFLCMFVSYFSPLSSPGYCENHVRHHSLPAEKHLFFLQCGNQTQSLMHTR